MDDSSLHLITRSPVLYSDEHLILVDKPEGVLSHPNPASDKNTKAAFEGKYDLKTRCFHSSIRPVYLIHRLDQDTSGVLLACWDPAVAETLRLAFEEGRVHKHYLALVAGNPAPKGIWQDYIDTRKEHGRVRSFARRSPKPNAKLTYRVKHYDPRFRLSLLDIQLFTGKTHQIRVQSASRANPVCGDDVYGNYSFNKKLKREIGLKRMFLHASSLEFAHPSTQKMMRFEAPLPESLKDCLSQIGC